MLLEIAGFWGLICLVMFYIAEWKNRNVAIGLIGGILLVLLGAWLLGDPLQIKTGESLSLSQTSIANMSDPNLTYTPTSGSETKSNIYTPVIAGFFNLNLSLGIIFMLVGIMACYRYAMQFKQSW